MTRIHVCSLAKVEEHLTLTGASHLVTLLGPKMVLTDNPRIPQGQHLRVGVSDIVPGDDGRMTPEHERDGHILPEAIHVAQVIAFARDWDRKAPMLIHCYAGVSRSTAAAYISCIAIHPALDENELAQELRRLSPTATPNPRLIALADEALGRNGRMIEAIRAIGRGEDCYEGVPFSLETKSEL